MAFDSFSPEMDPGRLRSKNDIKLLICYILSSIQSGLTKNDIVSLLEENNFANYFEATDAFSDLLSHKNITPVQSQANLYTVTESGRMISSQLNISLPLSVRERSLSAALSLLAKIKREQENSVLIKKNQHGYTVTCNISGGEINLMSFSIYVPDMMQANMVKSNFQKDPELLYRTLLALVTKDKNLATEVFDDMKQKKEK